MPDKGLKYWRKLFKRKTKHKSKGKRLKRGINNCDDQMQIRSKQKRTKRFMNNSWSEQNNKKYKERKKGI